MPIAEHSLPGSFSLSHQDDQIFIYPRLRRPLQSDYQFERGTPPHRLGQDRDGNPIAVVVSKLLTIEKRAELVHADGGINSVWVNGHCQPKRQQMVAGLVLAPAPQCRCKALRSVEATAKRMCIDAGQSHDGALIGKEMRGGFQNALFEILGVEPKGRRVALCTIDDGSRARDIIAVTLIVPDRMARCQRTVNMIADHAGE